MKKLTIVIFVFLNLMVFRNNSFAQKLNQSQIKCPQGVGVNSFNGNMNMQRNDLFIACRKFNLDMTFYYNSFDCNVNYGFGNGWRMANLMQYVKDSNGITIVRPNGREDFL